MFSSLPRPKPQPQHSRAGNNDNNKNDNNRPQMSPLMGFDDSKGIFQKMLEPVCPEEEMRAGMKDCERITKGVFHCPDNRECPRTT